ncbi:DnaJ-like protein subfamily C member 5 [Apostichopus japonicus]|uniref:DnaJ-like protein subfamily C member 5 n=1 Tax=Stichopus japonicus TaxID=307972 RepID=A0A2G8K791_STIJA|nr:DnaJ-like protein subfamily C member 5 [Apostichopus japonicus]
MQAAGLGEKKISVSSSKTAVELQARLMEEFPKLKDAGGYEYLRSTAQTKLLESISLPAGGGYSAANLKFVMKQARIYLRPIQAELDLSNMTVDEVTEEDELMIECNQCQMFFAQTKLKKHVTQCGRQTQERDEHDDTRPSAHGVVTETLSCSVERDGNDRQTEPAASEIQTGPSFCAPDIIGNDTPSTSGIQNESHFHVSDRCVQDYINLIEPASPSPSESDTVMT